jgi:transposase
LDARILADLLRVDLVYESYVPTKEFREKRSLVRHGVSLVRHRTMLENKVHSLLDKYGYRSQLADIFGKSGIIWLKTLDISTIDRLIMNTTLSVFNENNRSYEWANTVSRRLL